MVNTIILKLELMSWLKKRPCQNHLIQNYDCFQLGLCRPEFGGVGAGVWRLQEEVRLSRWQWGTGQPLPAAVHADYWVRNSLPIYIYMLQFEQHSFKPEAPYDNNIIMSSVPKFLSCSWYVHYHLSGKQTRDSDTSRELERLVMCDLSGENRRLSLVKQ